ncbi:MAG: hypothetical protein R2850_11890 [Bacteroidia bacterium]
MFKDAITAFNQAPEVDPNFGEALRFRGLVKGYIGKYQDALTDIHRALELSSGQGLANLDLLVVKILMGKSVKYWRFWKNQNLLTPQILLFCTPFWTCSDKAIFG